MLFFDNEKIVKKHSLSKNFCKGKEKNEKHKGWSAFF